MSFSDVHPGDPINASNVQQVIDALKGTAGKGVPLSPTAVNNATNYALTVENLEPTNSRALNVLKSDGSTLIKADATGVTLGSPITAPAASLPGSVLQNASVPNAALGPDVARANLLTNGGFEIWQRGNGPFTTSYSADRWTINPAGSDTLSVSKDTTNVDTGSKAAAACTFTLGTGAGGTLLFQIFQINTDGWQFGGRTLSASVRVRTSTANAVRLDLVDLSGATVSSTFHTGNGQYQTLTAANLTLVAASARLDFRLVFAASCTAYIDNAMLVVGSQAADYAPLHPADDLNRCLRYYEIVGSTNNELAMAGYNTAGAGCTQFIPYKAVKAVTPTITKNGTWQVTNTGQPVVPQSGVTGFSLQAIPTATGAYATSNNGASCFISVESNP